MELKQITWSEGYPRVGEEKRKVRTVHYHYTATVTVRVQETTDTGPGPFDRLSLECGVQGDDERLTIRCETAVGDYGALTEAEQLAWRERLYAELTRRITRAFSYE